MFKKNILLLTALSISANHPMLAMEKSDQQETGREAQVTCDTTQADDYKKQQEAYRKMLQSPEYQKAKAAYDSALAESQECFNAWHGLSKQLEKHRIASRKLRFSLHPYPSFTEIKSKELEDLRGTERNMHEKWEEARERCEDTRAQCEIVERNFVQKPAQNNDMLLALVMNRLVSECLLSAVLDQNIVKNLGRPNCDDVSQYCAQELAKILAAEKNQPNILLHPAAWLKWAKSVRMMRANLYLELERRLDL